jgi:uncharacterized protein
MRIWIATALIGLVFVGTVSAPARADCPAQSFTYRQGTVTFTEHDTTTSVRVEIADTEATQEYGLMCRTSLDENTGMLFIFADLTQAGFWMKNTLIPLSIAFFDNRWRIVGLMDMDVPPDPSANNLRVYTPQHPYRYALEVNLGFFARHQIDTKAQVRFVSENSLKNP